MIFWIAERYLFRRINQLRAANGLAPYRWCPGCAVIGRVHSRRMATVGDIFHGDEFEPRSWTATGQNVGATGADAASVADAFEQSPEHRANILDHDFIRCGVGAERRGGTLWVTENFLAP